MSYNRRSPYSDDSIARGGFFSHIKGTVYKWWCVVYKPVYKLIHHGNWPAEKEPGYIPPQQGGDTTSEFAAQMADTLMRKKQDTVNEVIAAHTNTTNTQNTTPVQNETTASDDTPATIGEWDDSIDTSGMSSESVDLAKEIMERLAREAAEDEAKKQAEIDQAKRVAAEKERLDEIMRANTVDISQYIEEGRAQQQTEDS